MKVHRKKAIRKPNKIVDFTRLINIYRAISLCLFGNAGLLWGSIIML